MVQVLRGKQRVARASDTRGSSSAGELLARFNARCSAASRQIAPFSARDVLAARFLLEHDCFGSLQRALRVIDAIFDARIRGASFFDLLSGYYAFVIDRRGRGPREASKPERRRCAVMIAEASRGAA